MELENQQVITINPTNDSPAIILDSANQLLKISGASYPENAVDIYSRVFEWIDKFDKFEDTNLHCEFYFNYLNSASRKIVYEMLLKLESLNLNGKKVSMTWYYDEFDEDMYDFGEELAELVNIPFEIIANED